METTMPSKRKTADDVLLTPHQVRERTGVALQTLANWRTRDMADPSRPSGGPPWVKVSGRLNQPGGEVRYPEKALMQWKAARNRPQVPPVHRATLRPSA